MPALGRGQEEDVQFGISCGVGEAQDLHIHVAVNFPQFPEKCKCVGSPGGVIVTAFTVRELGKEGNRGGEGNRRKEGKRTGCEETLQGWKHLPYHLVQCFHFLYFACMYVCMYLFIFVFSRAAPAGYGDSQARGLIEALATSLRHSHSKARSEPRLRLAPQLMATPDP